MNTASENEQASPIVMIGPDTGTALSFLEPSDQLDSPINNKPSGDSDSYEEDDDDEKEDNQECAGCQAAGNVDVFEAKVLRIAGHDLALAAFLIPLLHLMAHQEHTSPIKSRSIATTQCAGGADGKAADASAQGNQPFLGGGDERKRSARTTWSEQDMGKQEEDEDEQRKGDRDPKRTKASPGEVMQAKKRFACPFNKWRPEKYNIYSNSERIGYPEFRTCHGPGFTSINYLK